MNLTVAHHIPGRIRWRSRNRFTAALATQIADLLYALPGVGGVRVSPRCGSITVCYESKEALLSAMQALASLPVAASAPAPAQRQPGLAAAKDGYDWWPLERYVFVRPMLPALWNTLHTLALSIPFIGRGLASLLRGKVNVDVLDAYAVGVSLLMRDFRTAGLLLLLLGMGDMLERATKKKSLESLADQLSVSAGEVWVRNPAGGVRGQSVSSIAGGEAVVARTGSAIPVDGVVLAGEAYVNQASMTGEAMAVRKTPGAAVFAGTVVEDGEIDIRPTASAGNSRLNQIARFIEESEKRKSSIESKMQHIADAIVPLNFLLAGAVWLLSRSLARAASVLLVDYSCALRLATPLSVLSAMREGARNHVLIKGGRHLEMLAEADVIVFDKTGTLTQATPRLTDVVPAPGWDRSVLLKLAACLEEHFPHPVSHSIVRAASKEGLSHLIEAHDSEVRYVVAHGIRSSVQGRDILLGSRHFLEEDEGIDVSCMDEEILRLSGQGKTILYMAHAGKLIGLFGVEDPPKPNAAAVIRELKELGIRRVIMLTGDDPRTAENIAARLGLDDFRAQMLPEAKAEAVLALKREGHKVVMVGDGINDAPALSAADAGVSLRDGTDIAQEVADVVLTDNNLGGLPEAIRLSRAALSRIRTNYRASVALNSAFLAGGLFNVLPPAASALLHNGTTIGVCVNAIRGGYLQ